MIFWYEKILGGTPDHSKQNTHFLTEIVTGNEPALSAFAKLKLPGVVISSTEPGGKMCRPVLHDGWINARVRTGTRTPTAGE